jgi:hypothetical protein
LILGKEINVTAAVTFAADEVFTANHEQFLERAAALREKT